MESFFENCSMWAAKSVGFAFKHPTFCIISALLLLTKAGRAVLFMFLFFGTPIVICMRIVPMIRKHGWEKQALVITLVVIVCLNLPVWQAAALITAVAVWWFKKGRYMLENGKEDEKDE